MNESKSKLTLDQPVIYLIKVPGAIDAKWLDWNGGVAINIENDGEQPITTLTTTVDQAALHGLLKHLYAFGIPLISVVWKDYLMNEKE
jgi:hypothetical protein